MKAELNPADQMQLKIDTLRVTHSLIEELKRNVQDKTYRSAIDDCMGVISMMIGNYKRYIKQPKGNDSDDKG